MRLAKHYRVGAQPILFYRLASDLMNLDEENSVPTGS
jgi:hypothetical protein